MLHTLLFFQVCFVLSLDIIKMRFNANFALLWFQECCTFAAVVLSNRIFHVIVLCLSLPPFFLRPSPSAATLMKGFSAALLSYIIACYIEVIFTWQQIRGIYFYIQMKTFHEKASFSCVEISHEM